MTYYIEQTITDKNHISLEQLISACNAHDGIDFPLSAEEIIASKRLKTLFAYEDTHLIGFVFLQEVLELELIGVVHPAHRRKGIGTKLLDAAQTIIKQQDGKSLILVCPGGSSTGRAFIEATGAQYMFSEYHMVLDRRKISHPQTIQAGLSLRPATSTEVSLVIHLVANSFGDAEEDRQDWVAGEFQNPDCRFFIITLDDQPIGALRTIVCNRRTDITAFGILPEHRKRGYGRQILVQAVDMLLSEGWEEIALDVETENRNALGLYRACGFQEVREDGYYRLVL